MKQVHEIAREVLIEGVDDWVPIDRLIGYAQNSSPDVPHLVEEVLRYLFVEGLAEAGRIGDDGYAPEGSSAEVLEKVLADCEKYKWVPRGAGYWLSNTEKGDTVVS